MSKNKRAEKTAAKLDERHSGREKADECVRLIEHVFKNVIATDNERRAFVKRLRVQLMQLTKSVVSEAEWNRREAESNDPKTEGT